MYRMLNFSTHIKSELAQVNEGLIISDCKSEKLKLILNNLISAPSKKIRPIFAILYLKSIGLSTISPEQISIMQSVELVHTASLIHDDVIDNSSHRRNIQTINSQFDNQLAVIAGDFLISYALNKITFDKSLNLLNLFNQTFKTMCEAEAQQHFLKNTFPTESDYLTKTKQKTASLFVLILNACGQFVPDFDSQLAQTFAENLGIAFQLRNDLLQFLSSGFDSDDFKQGIYTLPLIYMNLGLSKSSAIEKTSDLIHNYLDIANDAISSIPHSVYKDDLIGVINWISKIK